MKKLIDVLIVLGAVSFATAIIMKLTHLRPGYPIHGFTSIAAWRFAIGCLAMSIALSLRKE